MKIVIGCDHAAPEYREMIKEELLAAGHEVVDLGVRAGEKADYPDVAAKAGRLVADGTCERGILICGTGIGMSIAANKIPGVRAACCSDPTSARLCRSHNDANVLCFGQRIVGSETAKELVEVFLRTSFEGGRHERRVGKISALDGERHGS